MYLLFIIDGKIINVEFVKGFKRDMVFNEGSCISVVFVVSIVIVVV